MKTVLVTSSILIVLLAALRPLLRGRIRPQVQYALWLVVALRLLIPVNLVTSAYSALALLERADEPPQIVQAIGQTAIPVQSYDDARTEVLADYLQQRGNREADLTPADLTAIDQQARELMRGPTVGELAARYARPVWLVGAALMAGWFLLVNLSLRRRLKAAKRLDGVTCSLPVYVSDVLPSPCLCGAARPAVYVTPAALDSPARLRHVLAHELTHYRHRDHWWALVRCACLCLYWFDPLVWWAAALSRQDCELACDEGAIRVLGEDERIPYGRTLVAMIAAGRNSLLQTATTMTGGRRKVRQRIMLIARRPKTVIAVALALALIVGCAVGCTFTGAPEPSPEPDPSPSLSPDEPRPALDTLQARLEDIPEELRGDVALYHGDAPQPEHSTTLAFYVLDNANPDWEGCLCILYQWDQVGFEDWLYSVGAGHTDVFARDGEHYYAFVWPTSVQYADEDTERYAAASRAIGDYARRQVLDTEGVEPYDPAELRQREYLWEGKTYTDVAYWPYKNITGDTEGSVWIIRLVQLAKDGEGGVWIPEREQIIDADVDSTPRHVKPSETREMGLTVTEYAQYLQGEADAGRADWATDPVQACMHYALTVCGHSEANVTEDCFTQNGAYIQDVLNRTLPSEEETAIQAVMDEIGYAPSVDFTLAPAGSGRVYAYEAETPLDSYLAYWITDFAKSFAWEKLAQLPGGARDGDILTIQTADQRSSVRAYSNSNLIAIQSAGSGEEYYMARDRDESPNNAPLGTPRLNPGPYQLLRNYCFDEVELQQLRATSVPDRGQSHEDVVREWVEGFEGAMTKCAPGSGYACTYVRPERITADAHAHLTPEEMADFVQYRGDGLTAEDYGKTWFSFGYSLVFVPENGDTNGPFWAGNTWYYEGDDAPEGALTWSRVGYMRLVDGSWVCEGCGTGW